MATKESFESTPSTSTTATKVFIITPEQIAQLGLTKQIQNVVKPQLTPKGLSKAATLIDGQLSNRVKDSKNSQNSVSQTKHKKDAATNSKVDNSRSPSKSASPKKSKNKINNRGEIKKETGDQKHVTSPKKAKTNKNAESISNQTIITEMRNKIGKVFKEAASVLPNKNNERKEPAKEIISKEQENNTSKITKQNTEKRAKLKTYERKKVIKGTDNKIGENITKEQNNSTNNSVEFTSSTIIKNPENISTDKNSTLHSHPSDNSNTNKSSNIIIKPFKEAKNKTPSLEIDKPVAKIALENIEPPSNNIECNDKTLPSIDDESKIVILSQLSQHVISPSPPALPKVENTEASVAKNPLPVPVSNEPHTPNKNKFKDLNEKDNNKKLSGNIIKSPVLNKTKRSPKVTIMSSLKKSNNKHEIKPERENKVSTVNQKPSSSLKSNAVASEAARHNVSAQKESIYDVNDIATKEAVVVKMGSSRNVKNSKDKSPREKSPPRIAIPKEQQHDVIETPKAEGSRKSGRKRKAINYASLDQGEDIEESVLEKIPKDISNEDATINPTINSNTPMKRKRGRPPKVKEANRADDDKESTNLNESESSLKEQTPQDANVIPSMPIETEIKNDTEMNETNTSISEEQRKQPLKRKRGRPKASSVSTVQPDTNETSPEGEKPKDKRRGRKANTDSAERMMMNSLLDVIQSPAPNSGTKLENRTGEEDNQENTSITTEPSKEIPSLSEGDVVCAVCNKHIAKGTWLKHKLRYHNDLAWRVGDPPLDLNNRDFVINVLNDLYRRKKNLHCSICDVTKKSVLGLLSHQAQCGKSMEEVVALKVTCKYCSAKVLPVSLNIHYSFCKANTDLIKNKNVLPELQVPEEDLNRKRKAAVKAIDLIKTFQTDEVLNLSPVWRQNNKVLLIKSSERLKTFVLRQLKKTIDKNGEAINCPFDTCTYKSGNENEFSSHIETCEAKIDQGYLCKRCSKMYKTSADIYKHIKELHKNVSDVDYESENDTDDSDEEYEENYSHYKKNEKKKYARASNGIKFVHQNRYFSPTTPILYRPAYEWALNFCTKNYSVENLFASLKLKSADLVNLNPELILKYLPPLRYSACVAQLITKTFVDPLTSEHDWKRYKLFEAERLDDGTSTIFCGGPIFALAWMPTPYNKDNCEQIVAVSVGSDMDNSYKLNETYLGHQLIQFWNCGSLKEETNDVPKLQFCIAHDYGIAWCLEWCPSGCYDVNINDDSPYLQRLGLLAIGCTNSNIYIYSVCNSNENSKCKIFKQKPILMLSLGNLQEKVHVTKLSWSKAAGHQYIAAGYGNGLIAIFDLNTKSSLLKSRPNNTGIETLMPYQVIKAHYYAVTALSLYHLNHGCRWLMTGSTDRSFKYWDLENPSFPVTCSTKYNITDGVWLNHWLSSLFCFDDCYSTGLMSTTIYQFRDFESDHATVMYSNSCVSSISGSEWANGFVQGNTAGELEGFFPHQLFCGMDHNKAYRRKKVMIGYARIVEKNVSIQERLKNEEEAMTSRYKKPVEIDTDEPLEVLKHIKESNHSKFEPITYDDVQNKYGLVFCDIKTSSIKYFIERMGSYTSANKMEKFYPSKPNIYPLQAVKRVALNPNKKSFSFLAVGYQAGFVRISHLNFMKNSR